MAVGIVPFIANPDQAMSYSLPEAVSLAFFDDGGGGQIYLNGLGVVDSDLSGAVDLKTLFETNGALFRSYPLLSAFRRISTNTSFAAMTQFVANLRISIFPLSVGGVSTLPQIAYLAAIGGVDNVPFLNVAGPVPGAAGTWRIDISLRHTLTN